MKICIFHATEDSRITEQNFDRTQMVKICTKYYFLGRHSHGCLINHEGSDVNNEEPFFLIAGGETYEGTLSNQTSAVANSETLNLLSDGENTFKKQLFNCQISFFFNGYLICFYLFGL